MKKTFQKFRNLPAGAKASVAFFFASLVTSGVSYLVTPIYTRLLPPEVYGQASIFFSWVQIFGIVAMFCLSYGVFNNGMVDYPDKRGEFSFSMLVLSNVITLGFSVALLFAYPLLKDVLGIDFPLLVLMCILFLVQPAYSFWAARQRYELKYKYTVFWTIMVTSLSQFAGIACIMIWKDEQLYARLLGTEVASILIYFGFYLYLAIKNRWHLETKYWKPAILFNLPLIPHYLSMYLLRSSNKILISNIIGDAQVAYYSVAQAVATIVTMVWTAINTSLIPYTYEKCKKKDFSAISNVTMPILTGFAGACVLATMFAPEVVAIVATPDYMEAIYVIPPIVGGVFFQVQYFIYANIVYYYKKSKYVMYASVTSVVLNFVLGYFLISEFGYLAAGYATLLCYLLQAALDYVAMRRVVKEPVYNMRYIGFLSLLVVGLMLISHLLYSSILIRYGIVLLIVIACIVMRKRIVGIFKVIKNK